MPKKPYVKPMLHYETFLLTQSIAAGCGAAHDSNLGGPNHGSKTTCGWNVGGVALWTESNSGCNTPLDENADGGGICYNNPNGGASIFSSY